MVWQLLQLCVEIGHRLYSQVFKIFFNVIFNSVQFSIILYEIITQIET